MILAAAVVYRRMLPPRPSLRLLSRDRAGSERWCGLRFVAVARPFLAAEVLDPRHGPSWFCCVHRDDCRAIGRLSFARTALFALGWTVMVFVPVALFAFAGLGPFGLRPIDQGGSLAVNVAAGAAALGATYASRQVADPTGERIAAAVGSSERRRGSPRRGVARVAGGVGTRRRRADIPRFSFNGLAGALGGVVGWLFVQRIRHQSTTLGAVAAGLVSGLVAVSAGSAMLTPVAAFAAAVLASSAACLFTLARVSDSSRQQWFIVGSHLIAGAVGLVTLGLFANDFGFLFTGQYVVLRDQVIACILVAAYSMAISVGLWIVLRKDVVRTAVLEHS